LEPRIEEAARGILRRVRRAIDRAVDPSEEPGSDLPVALNRPIMIAAFEGWNDAGDAASYATNYLARLWGAEPLAEIDPDRFFDFTEVRPEASIGEDGTRRILWPTTSFSLVPGVLGGRDIVIVRGPEPQLRWRTYCAAIIELAKGLGIERVVTRGAYLGEVTHSRATPVTASSSDPALASRYQLSESRYEGPTGIIGVLAAAFAEASIPTISFWASVPCYSLPVSPKAALALVQVTVSMAGREVDLDELEEDAADYEQKMDELVAEDENVAAYVARIEEMEQAVGSDLSAEGLTEEIERYLRNNKSSPG
jgi:predicted ATP-grasp superfamily ATP-dependent carboligase